MRRYISMLATLVIIPIAACTVSGNSNSGTDNNDAGGTSSSSSGNSNNPNDPLNPMPLDDGGVADVEVPETVPTCGDYPEKYPGLAKCKVGSVCKKHSDCLSDACSYKHTCIADKSCVAHYGGDTCGQYEVNDPRSLITHESCCKTAKLPSGAELEIYSVTAGRVRQLVERTNGNIKGWFLENRSKLNAAVVAQLDPYVNYLPSSNTLGEQYSVPEQLGSHIYSPDLPSSKQGCFISGTGNRSYWFPPEVNNFYGDIQHGFPQEVLDTKPINCITLEMSMAVCAFDNKKLQTFEEHMEAYGSGRFAWGDSPEPAGWGNISNIWTKIGPSDKGFGVRAGACPSCVEGLTNWSWSYEFPPRNPDVVADYSYWLAAPGRHPFDTGAYGHKDLTANIITWTATDANYTDKAGRSPTHRLSTTGSYEGHDSNHTGYAFHHSMKYGKVGGKCSVVR